MNSNCVGNKFLKELNPTNTSINKEKLISQIKRLINESYLFMGYREFAKIFIKYLVHQIYKMMIIKIQLFKKKN